MFQKLAILIVIALSVILIGQIEKPSNSIESVDNLTFVRVNHQGQRDRQGANYVIVFDPRSPHLEFKVNLALDHPLYAQDAGGNLRQEYVAKRFHQIIADENSLWQGQRPIAAINGDYIDPQDHPQGLNISRGIEYSGEFKNLRSSFGISEGKPQQRRATIQIGERSDPKLNFNIVGGNGRFYQAGIFKDICADLGEFACRQETNRSMAAITDRGQVILLVNSARGQRRLFPEQFDDVLEGVAQQFELGKIEEAMLFDGGLSTGLYFNGKILIENSNPIGSALLIYHQP